MRLEGTVTQRPQRRPGRQAILVLGRGGAHLEFKGLAPVPAGVKLLAVQECAGVVHHTLVAFLWEAGAIPGLGRLLSHSHLKHTR